MALNHPYQVARVCKHAQFEPHGLLLAACGGHVISVNLADGSVVSQYPEKQNDKSSEPSEEGPPGKKRKLEHEPENIPNVLKIALSSDHRHAVVVTEDKCIRVFEVTNDGKLTEISQRMMPKRPCAVLVTPDNKTILCGDKFGDVYSLPLIPSSNIEEEEATPKPEPVEDNASKKYVPTATVLTVHSGRNRRALENQLKQKELHAKAKEGPKFEHQLLLGHVSMLTDLVFATEQVDDKSRGYIITADRDEHIRVSRGPPQGYVVERFCLGHNEFISKLCLLPENNTLLSGGGDDWLGVWDWQTGTLQQKCDMRSAMKAMGTEGDRSMAVSGIWTVPATCESDGQHQSKSAILVASDKQPFLLVTPQDSVSSSTAAQFSGVQLPGNPLDVMVVGERIIVSTDATQNSASRLQAYTVHITEKGASLVPEAELNTFLQSANEFIVAAPERKKLDELLYGIGNLRKRGTEEGRQGPEEPLQDMEASRADAA